MVSFDWDEFVAGSVRIEGNVSLTIGVFDGVHIGHKALLSRITGGPGDSIPVVFTFRENPALIMRPESFAGNISSLAHRKKKLDDSRIRFSVLIDFSGVFSKITGEKFIALLKDRLEIKKIAVGSNFYFGYRREVDGAGLMRLARGIDIEVVDPIQYNGEIVSSTRIRNAIRDGEIESVNSMLGEEYFVDLEGAVCESEGCGFSILTNKVNQVLPSEGTYRIRIGCQEGTEYSICRIRDSRLKVDSYKEKQCSSINNIQFIEKHDGRS